MPSPSRREVLVGGAAAAGLGLAEAFGGSEVVTAAMTQSGQIKPTKAKRSLRIAHLTDIHVQPEKKADEGMAHTLRQVNSLKDKPNLIITGGDQIMDAFGAGADRTKAQWDLYQKALKNDNDLPIEHCIGNHDVWSFKKREGAEAAKEGKKWAMDELGLTKPYRSFDRAGWHFIVLDSTFPRDAGYVARLDEEQFEWLADDLNKTPSKTPILIVSHIPIICFCAFFDGDNEKSGNWQVPGAWMHIDARRIKDLFAKHPNVKAAISGHIHLIDRVDYNGVSYYCNGAVSGGWWGGSYQECKPGYGILDLYADGTVACDYLESGWKAQT